MRNPLSPAEQYRLIREAWRLEQLQNIPEENLFDVKVTSGMVFKCRRPERDTYIINGMLPTEITQKLIDAAKAKGKEVLTEEEAAAELNDAEGLQMLVFAREMVRDICVIPRIVEKPQNGDEIAPSDLLLEDWRDILKWGMSFIAGGRDALVAESFRKQSGKDAVGRPRGKKRTVKTK